MKASELVKHLQDSITRFGDEEVFLQTMRDGTITEQQIGDIWSGNNIIIVSKESSDAPDLLDQLPTTIIDVQ